MLIDDFYENYFLIVWGSVSGIMASSRGRGRPPRASRSSRDDQPSAQGEAGPSGSSGPQELGDPGVRELLQEMARSMAHMASAIGRGGVEQMPAVSASVPALDSDPQLDPLIERERSERRMKLYLDFSRFQPPVFEGGPDPAEAEAWFSEMSRLLRLGMIFGDERVVLAASFLRKEAQFWWESVERTQDVSSMSWSDFEAVFYGKYFGRAVRAARRQEFSTLVQGSLTVAQYETRFSELSRFAPELISTEELRARRFEDGLMPYIWSRLVALCIGDYPTLVERALLVERERDDSVRARDRDRERHRSSGLGLRGRGSQARPAPSAPAGTPGRSERAPS